MVKPILCVDFDGVIHSYVSGWQGVTSIADAPVPGALPWLWRALEWWEVVIYSSRSQFVGGRAAMHHWLAVHAAEELGSDHPLASPLIEHYPLRFAYEKPAAFLTIDDRCICFDGDWSELEPAALLDFRPWNKRLRQTSPAAERAGSGVPNADDRGRS